MKPARKPTKPNPTPALETFGGDYHRLESTFRRKEESARPLPRTDEKRRGPGPSKRNTT